LPRRNGVSHDAGVPPAKRKPRRFHRGEGSVYFSKSDRTWIAWFPLGMRDGKRTGKRARARSFEAARAKLDDLRRAYGAGVDPAAGTLDEYLAEWLESHRGPRESTRMTYALHVKLHISPLLGGIRVADLRPADVRWLIADRLKAGKSAAYVRRIVTTLHIALQRGVDERRLSDNAAHGVQLPRVEQHVVEAMSDTQAAAIVDAVKGTYLEGLVALLEGSGMRLGEALGLDQGDLHLDERWVQVRTSKTTVRAIRISDDAAAALERHVSRLKVRGDAEPLFVGPKTGERLRGQTVSHALPRILEANGLPALSPHALRHGVATRMVAKGVPMRHVAEQLGHRNPSLTERTYAHVAPESLAQHVRLLNRKTGA
jgi:integrase